MLGFRAAKRQSTVKQRGCTILALLYRRVGRLAHLDLAARSPETMVRRDGTLTIILSGLREFQQTTPVDVRSCPSCARSSSTSNIGAPMHRATKQLRRDCPSSTAQKALDLEAARCRSSMSTNNCRLHSCAVHDEVPRGCIWNVALKRRANERLRAATSKPPVC